MRYLLRSAAHMGSMLHFERLSSMARALGGLPVWGTVTGSAADRAGLRKGDIVLRINGVSSLLTGHRLVPGPFGELELEVLREDSLVALSLPPDLDACVVDELSQQLLGRRSSN